MEFLNVKSQGKDPHACRVENNFIEVVNVEAIASMRFEFLPRKNSKTEEWQLVTGAKVTTINGTEFELSGGTARRLYAKVENTMLKI